jgi:2-oxoisovalerate dehydrogenase E2 component (dihydrolipoyl transacylase)
MIVFRLPDLGEGLSDAEIVRWHVGPGDQVHVDQPMVSVETAKAVVEVPSPVSAIVAVLHAQAGDRVETGAPLIEFTPLPGTPEAAHDSAPGNSPSAGDDSCTVVGHMQTHPAAAAEYADAPAAATARGGMAAQGTHPPRVRAVPAARALARSLGVDLETVRGTGRGGLITLDDVMAAGLPQAPPPDAASTLRPHAPATAPATLAAGVEVLRSLRRAMAQSMSLSRDNVMECSVFDDADLHRWQPNADYTPRVIRAIAAAVRVVPGLNAWYDADSQSRRLFEHVDVGVAVDTPDGLLVPVIRDVGRRAAADLRQEIDRLKRGARARTLTSEELRNFTFMLSNFGMMAGRYATPVVVPPAVAILGTGRVREDVIAAKGRVEIHRRMPLSLTFDHRVVTGGEAVRFLGAVIADLELPE